MSDPSIDYMDQGSSSNDRAGQGCSSKGGAPPFTGGTPRQLPYLPQAISQKPCLRGVLGRRLSHSGTWSNSVVADQSRVEITSLACRESWDWVDRQGSYLICATLERANDDKWCW